VRRKKAGIGSDPMCKSRRKVSGKVQVFGWLDRHRRILEFLEEAIENAREMSQARTGRGHDNASRLEWTKAMMRLIEVYDAQLHSVKRHIWGATGEPGEVTNGAVEFERDFQRLVLDPWTQEDLKLECEDCGTLSEDVSNYEFELENFETERHDLCPRCYSRRRQESASSRESNDEAEELDSS